MVDLGITLLLLGTGLLYVGIRWLQSDRVVDLSKSENDPSAFLEGQTANIIGRRALWAGAILLCLSVAILAISVAMKWRIV